MLKQIFNVYVCLFKKLLVYLILDLNSQFNIINLFGFVFVDEDIVGGIVIFILML